MHKSTIALFTLILLFSFACEKDDFCTQNPVTPSLVIRFYDKDSTNESFKTVERFSAIAAIISDSLSQSVNTDSIILHLNTLADETTYTFKRNEEIGNTDTNEYATLKMTYAREEEFVSRSCGFRIFFTTVTFEKNGWIDSLSVSELPVVNNQNNAHVKVYH